MKGSYLRTRWAEIVGIAQAEPEEERTGEEIDRELSLKFGWTEVDV